MAGKKQHMVSGDPQRKQAMQQHTLKYSTWSAATFSLVAKEHVTLDGCEVTTATVVRCVVSFDCEMALLLASTARIRRWELTHKS